MACSHLANALEAIRRLFGVCRQHANAINRETCTQSQFFKSTIAQRAREPRDRPKTQQDKLKTSIAVHRCRCSAGGILGFPPPTQETLRVIACKPVPQEKKKQGRWRRNAPTTHAVALVCSRRCLSALCEMLRFSDFFKKKQQIILARGLRSRTQTRTFPSNRIQKVELDSFSFFVKIQP